MKDAYSFDVEQAGAPAQLQQNVVGLSAHAFHRLGLEIGFRCAPESGPIERQSQPRIHTLGAKRRVGSFLHKD